MSKSVKPAPLLEAGRRVAGKRALVTGAARGIGLACAQKLIAEGAEVVITDLDPAVAGIAAEIGAEGRVQDVSREDEWMALAEHLRVKPLDILVNNAAISGDPDLPKDPENAPLSDWENVFRVDAAGVFLACKYMIPLMAASGGGSIINFGSVACLVPVPMFTAYGAAKAAVVHLTQSVALHCAQAGYGIRANAVHPGQVRTPMLEALFERQGAAANSDADVVAAEFRKAMIPLNAFQEPEDIAALVLFLASDEARYITGQSIACDGGFTLIH